MEWGEIFLKTQECRYCSISMNTGQNTITCKNALKLIVPILFSEYLLVTDKEEKNKIAAKWKFSNSRMNF